MTAAPWKKIGGDEAHLPLNRVEMNGTQCQHEPPSLPTNVNVTFSRVSVWAHLEGPLLPSLSYTGGRTKRWNLADLA